MVYTFIYNTHTVTSDVQQASITFFQNNIFMMCTFANTITALGCIFNLTLTNSTEMFYLPRDEMAMVSQCNISSSQRMAYTSIEVMDWESDGNPGTLRIPIMPVVVSDDANYTQLTGCVVESKSYGIGPTQVTSDSHVYYLQDLVGSLVVSKYLCVCVCVCVCVCEKCVCVCVCMCVCV